MAGLIKSAMPVVSGVVCVSEATGVAGRSFGRVAMITTLRIEERRVASRRVSEYKTTRPPCVMTYPSVMTS